VIFENFQSFGKFLEEIGALNISVIGDRTTYMQENSNKLDGYVVKP
jgi:hypothetical protein